MELSLPGGAGGHHQRWLCLIHAQPGSVKGQGPRSGQRIIKNSEEEEAMVVLECQGSELSRAAGVEGKEEGSQQLATDAKDILCLHPGGSWATSEAGP